MSDDAFSLLATPIQRVLWDMGWEALRPIQEKAIREILQRDRDLIIAARTAAGKTEAAFLPILSRIYAEPKPSVQAVYVGPLKALINDQFRRLEELCQRAEIAVHRWHGDVDAGAKTSLINSPSGVLLITPESIESLFVNRSTALTRLFRHLSFVVIDEIHALVGSERGTHLRSLLCRLTRNAERDFRKIGLSATLGGAFDQYADWLRPNCPEQVCMIDDAGEQKRILYKVHAYASRQKPSQDDALGADDIPPPGIVEEMYEHLSGRKNLLFANRKEDVEWFADLLNRRGQELGRPKEFLVHHGSLSKEVREFTEREMQGRRPQTAVCSSTLELGIDIGNVTAVGQIDPPWSVSSLVQRLGRSGRGESEPQCMRVYVRQQLADEKAPLEKRLYPDLLRTIAVTELMLEEPRWVEPPAQVRFDFSTLTQQVLSILAETGGITALNLYDRLVTNGAFRGINQELFAKLLRSLAGHELIQQMDAGDLILAPEGEKIVNHYSFYSAFATPTEYSVAYEGQLIGTLPALYVPLPGDHFILGGRRWQVVEVDDDRRDIVVHPARSSKPPRFLGAGGEIHSRVRQQMRAVLLGTKSYSFLNQTAAKLLEDARGIAWRTRLAETPLVTLGDGRCLWFTWTGTRIQRTLCLIAHSVGLDATDRDIAIEFEVGAGEVRKRLERAVASSIDPFALATTIPAKELRKFDEFVSDELLTHSLAEDAIDLEGAMACLRGLHAGEI